MTLGRTLLAVGLATSVVLSVREARAQDAPAPEPAPQPATEPPATEPPAATPPDTTPFDTTPPTAASPAPAAAPRRRRFGEAGQWVTTADSSLYLSSTEYSVTEAKYFSVGFSPGFDYFFTRGVSVGVDLDVGYDYARGFDSSGDLVVAKTTTVGGGVRVGFNIPLGDTFSFYPRLTLGGESSTREVSGSPAGPSFSPQGGVSVGGVGSVGNTPLSVTAGGPYAVVFAPLLLHPAEHFFIGAGPGVFVEVGDAHGDSTVGGPRTSVFGRILIGGWWGGESPAAESSDAHDTSGAPASPSPSPSERFGERNEWVLSGEVGGSVARTSYTGGNSTFTRLSLRPSVDYFVISRLSFGLGALLDYSNRGGDGAANSAAPSSLRLGATGRVGVDLPLSSSFSFYPRASLGVSRQTLTQNRLSATADTSRIGLEVALYAPLLFHVRPHFFVGFGPSVAHDLVHHDQRPGSVDNLATTFGPRHVIGGWL